MRMRIREIDSLVFSALVLFVGYNGVTEAHGKKDHVRSLTMLKELKNLRHGILPGTRWCGRGNIARNDSELGAYKELDGCCRAHDRCDDYIRPKSERYGLRNKYICRSSLCECEVQFYDCLAQITGLYASFVGRVYFRKCKQCFRTYYSMEECEREGLDVIDENDRNGRRVFCARFDRNPKWKRGRNVMLPNSTFVPKLLTTSEADTVLASRVSFVDNDRKYFNDDDDDDDDDGGNDIVYENLTSIDHDDDDDDDD